MDTSIVQTLPEISISQAINRSESIAYFSEIGEEVSFLAFHLLSNQVANGLIGEGIRPGKRVAILAKDGISSFQILFGCAKARAVLVPINWRLSPEEILYILNDAQVEVLFVEDTFLANTQSIASRFSSVKKIIILSDQMLDQMSFVQWRDLQSQTTPEINYHARDVVVQMYTSGTTGQPKGVQLANDSFFRLMQGMRQQGDEWMSINSKDRLLLALPMFHIGGLWWAMQGFIAGSAGVIMETFVAWKALELIDAHQISKLALVPAMIQFVLAEPASKDREFSSVTGLLYGGSPISVDLLRLAQTTFKCDFFQAYGMTETGNIAVSLRPEDHTIENDALLKAAGKPLPGVEAKIIDSNGEQLQPGQSGEICLKSPSNMVGYWNNPLATDATLIDQWVHTGDIGYINEDGYIFVCDRVKDMIIYAGENIFPAEIETALTQHKAVNEAAVIGIPDDRWGEVVKAFVVLHPGEKVKTRELLSFVRLQIADFKVPKSVEFIDSLPRNPSGKVLKRELRMPYWAGRERQVS